VESRGRNDETKRQRIAKSYTKVFVSDVVGVSVESFPIPAWDLIGDKAIFASSSCLRADFSPLIRTLPI
jgi:hypothetical protein